MDKNKGGIPTGRGLSDLELDDVSGGCGHRKRRGGRRKGGNGGGGDRPTIIDDVEPVNDGAIRMPVGGPLTALPQTHQAMHSTIPATPAPSLDPSELVFDGESAI